MPYRRFVLANLAGGIVWVTLAVTGGYLLAPELHRLLTIAVVAGSAMRWVLLLGVAGFATFRVVRWYRSS